MAERLSIEAAVARFEPRDTLGIPLGTGQPAALLKALGERTDWQDLRVYGALLLVGTELFKPPWRALPVRFLRPRSSAPCATPAPTSASSRPTSARFRCWRSRRRG